MDHFRVPNEVEEVFEQTYQEMIKKDGMSHRSAIRLAIHEALLKEAELGLIAYTEKAVNWRPPALAGMTCVDGYCYTSGDLEKAIRKLRTFENRIHEVKGALEKTGCLHSKVKEILDTFPA